jgi:hypothetical protein
MSYRTVTPKAILEGVASRVGQRFEKLNTATVVTWLAWLDDRVAEAWEVLSAHPDLMEVEQRYFQGGLWLNGSTYSTGDIVYGATAGKYFTSLVDANTGNEPVAGGDANWEETDLPFRRLIDWEQTGQTKIESVRLVSDVDPRLYKNPIDQGLRVDLWDDAGFDVPGSQAWVWVWFQRQLPQFSASYYSSTAVYAGGEDRIYWPTDGEVYDVVTTTTAGDTPVSASAKFSKVALPYVLERFLKLAVAADYYTDQNQEGSAEVHDRRAQKALDQKLQQLYGSQRQLPKVRISRPVPAVGRRTQYTF